MGRLLRWLPWVLFAVACDDGGTAATGDAAGDAAPVAADAAPPFDAAAPGDDAAAPRTDGGAGDAAARPDAGRDATTDGAMPVDAESGTPDAGPPKTFDLPPGAYPARACDVLVRTTAPDAGSVRIAGEFTDWATAPRDLERQADGAWQIRLAPDDRLRSGGRYAYKLIVDDTWRLDPDAALRKWDGDCLNSAIEMPACDTGPELRGHPVAATPDGTARVEIDVLSARDGVAPRTATLTLDGDALPEGALRADAGRLVVTLTGLAPGRHVVDVEAEDAMGRDAAPISLPFWIEARPFDWRGATLYMIVIDRFADGDRASNRPSGVEYPADWHGGDLWGALEVMRTGYFEDLGVDAIWLSPANQQVDGAFGGRDDGRQYAAYHGYWPTMAREVEPRFGGEAALRAFVIEAHRRGIRVLLDLINNQVHEQHQYFSEFPTWFRTGCVCGNDPGCGWSERPFDCLFAPYLPDIDWRNPDAERQFIDDARYWIDAFGVDGFRVDAVKHVESNSIYNLRAMLAQRFEQGGTRVVMLGETAVGEGDRFDDGCGEQYGDGYAWVDAYTGPRALDGQFDFPSHHRMQWGLLTGQMGFDELDRIVADMERRYRADALHVRFLGSHDSSRMASRAALDPARDCRWQGGGACDLLPGTVRDADVYRRLERAFTLLYTVPGIPLLYYGDEIAMPGGNDPDNRRDMAWDGALERVAMGVARPAAAQLALRERVAALGRLRQRPALQGGDRRTLVAEPDLYVFARTRDDDVALVVLNRGGAVADRRLEGLGARAMTAAVGEAEVRIDGDALRLSVPAGGAAVLVPAE